MEERQLEQESEEAREWMCFSSWRLGTLMFLSVP